MKIGVMSDTHLTVPSDELIEVIEGHFQDMDMIFHAGDIVGKEVLKAFSGRDLRAVSGNMDSAEIKDILPYKQVIEAGKFRVGLIHGAGAGACIEDKLVGEFEDVDCIVYGHTHSPANHLVDGVLLFNPGALVDRWYGKGGSFGILELNDTIKGTIIKL